MTLPYPPELERGALRPPAAGPRSTVDIPALVAHMVQPSSGAIAVVGQDLTRPAAAGEEDILEAFRAAITERLLERAPNATIETVRHLETVLQAELAHHEIADRETLDVILETIDGL